MADIWTITITGRGSVEAAKRVMYAAGHELRENGEEVLVESTCGVKVKEAR